MFCGLFSMSRVNSRPKWRGPASLVATAFQGLRTQRPRSTHGFVGSAGFANSRFPGNRDQTTCSLHGFVDCAVEDSHLDIASNEGAGIGLRDVAYVLLGSFTDEAIAPTVSGLDPCLFLATIPECLARGGNTARKNAVRDELARPNRREKFFFVNHAIAIFDQIAQDIKILGSSAIALSPRRNT